VLPGGCLGGVPTAELPPTLSLRPFHLERPLTFPRGRRTKRRTRKVLLGSPRVWRSKPKRLRRLLRNVAAAPDPSSSSSRLKKASASRRGAKTLSDVGAWAKKEGATLELKDARLGRRAVEMLSRIGSHPTASIPQAMGTWAGPKGASRVFEKAKGTREALWEAHSQARVPRLEAEEGSVVIAGQDTPSLEFTSHTDTSGLGPLEPPARQGLLGHSTLGVTPQGLPIGLLGQKVWVRQKAKAASRTRPCEAKESFRGLEEEQKVRPRLPETFSIVTVADREADVYDLFAAERPASAHLLIRAAQNRRVQQEQRTLWPALEAQPELGRVVVRINRAKDRKEREALLSIRTRSGTILSPKERRGSEGLQPVPLQASWVHEEAAPRGSTPIGWMLFTTVPGESLEEAVRCLQGDTLRWLVERYHLALKSGVGSNPSNWRRQSAWSAPWASMRWWPGGFYGLRISRGSTPPPPVNGSSSGTSGKPSI